MTEQDLLDAGYKRWKNPPHLMRLASHFYQRAVMEDDKKVYFINVWCYPPVGAIRQFVMEAEVQLYLPGDRWMTLEVHGVETWPLEQMEAVFFAAYVKLGCVVDPYNND